MCFSHSLQHLPYVFPGECHPISYEGLVCVHGLDPFSGLDVPVFCLLPPSGSFCFVVMYVSQLASNSSLCLPKAGTTSMLHHAWYCQGTVPTLGWPCGPPSWAWLVHPCHSTFRVQLRSRPSLASCLFCFLSLFPSLLSLLPCGFEGRGRAVPLGSVLWQPLDSLSI